MKKYNVEYSAGEARNGNESVDYMLVEIDGVELYAEAAPDPEDETATYDGLKAEIIRQAEKNGINKEALSFLYD